MRKLVLTLVLSLFLTGAASVVSAGDIDPGLEKVMESMTADQQISVLVYLNNQTDLSGITDQMDSRNATLRYRHEMVVRSLQETANNTQAEMISFLDNLQAERKVLSYENFWVTNAFKVETTADMVKTVADHPSVSTVYFNYEIELIEPVDVKPSSGKDIANVEVGVDAVRADEVWAMGIDGSGVLVANMDTGVEGDHPALEDTWAGVADPRYQGHPEWAWYDPYNNQNDFPYDNHGHGTHTIGSVCGRDNNTGDTIGCAPGAYWIASAPIDRGGGIPRTVADAILSFQWMVDPDGNPSTNWDVPDVCSNSWGVTTYHGYPPCDTLFWNYLDACEAAGTVILFSAGNEGSSGLRRPSDRATDDFRTCAVAAVDANQSGWPIASFSSRGPTYCTPDGSAAIKPDISAPGVDVRSAYPGGGYTTMSGTSMASPHVNGVVALIRQANPNLSVEMVKQIIYDTAYDLGPTGEDNSYGWGMIDAYEAVQVALSYLDGYGFIRGRVTDFETGVPLEGQLTVTNRDPQISAQTRENGWYTLIVPADSVWEVTCEVPNSLYVPKIDSMSVASGDTAYLNFRMMLPGVTMSMLPHNAPIIVQAGNSFTFTGVLESNSDQTQTTDVWIMLDVPGIGEYGPVQQFNNITLQPFQQLIAWSVAQYVPAFAPNGIYDYLGYCGDYPSIIVDTAQFSFTVYGGTLGSPDENDWKLAGWFDEGQSAGLPSEFRLHGNVPNPFNAQTRIQFELPVASTVNLSVYNLAGQKVATLVDGYREAGVHNINWDASSYSSGIYFYKLSAGERVTTRKMSLLK